MPEILLDTSFMLPTLGIEVAEIGRKDLEELKALSDRATLHCSYVSFVEILGLLGKRFKNSDDTAVRSGIKSLLESGTYHWANPSSRAVHLALDLRAKGHKDNIDNILYSTALDSEMYFLSLDLELKRFLDRNKYDTSIIGGTSDLLRRI